MFSIPHKRAVITGGKKGIGFAIADQLMKWGVSVVLADHRPEPAREAAQQLRDRYSDEDTRVLALECDVREFDQVKEMVARVRDELGAPDLLINNAARAALHRSWETPEEEWDEVLGVTLRGAFLCTRQVLSEMIDRGLEGAVINIGSINQLVVTEGLGSYSAAKAGLEQLTRVTAAEVGPYGIRVNSLAPGITRTELTEQGGFLEGDMLEEYQRRTPLERIGEPEDVARAALLLASNYAGWITGQTLYADGGLHLKGLQSYWDTMGLDS